MILVFAFVRLFTGAVHLEEDELADFHPANKTDGKNIGIVKLQCEPALKARSDNARILNEQPRAANGASPFYKSGNVVWQLNVFPCGGKYKRVGWDDNFFTCDLLMF